MYSTLLSLHSLLRWIILLEAVFALAFFAMAWRRTSWGSRERVVLLSLVITMDVMFVVGLALYFVSPVISAALAAPGLAMKNAELRRAFMEHPVIMIAALAVLHVGNVIVRKAVAEHRGRLATVFVLATLVLLCAGIPWQRLHF